jgi:hypothetical protein
MMTASMRASRVEWSHLCGLNFEPRAPVTPDSWQLFHQVTGIANGPEQRATRRRSVHPAVQDRPGPSATWIQLLLRKPRPANVQITSP